VVEEGDEIIVGHPRRHSRSTWRRATRLHSYGRTRAVETAVKH